ncbi:chromosome transmission fidelity protein 18 homolog isoform x1 [Plasmopara halstedii]|uniref:Chromosome transmission fidelity protein 18 homolog isoform x1 n=1 Tax=Plasmopara halstedii TaxID=4781 RepID=A0A0P1AJX5_PLAHL|nr:chromosome transmission fidelity protein 18 homolog isoform x1 [Plasmopara halstedii]CEG40886.1 chromosome transmission fidelity protein 18 homolog isoform x1 [Plasmopara halstedii]|eukprot:XP_024577255.1 chromosome transmission fidelity protein 18 homolog isoform x1 [Plasmopara halstedii]
MEVRYADMTDADVYAYEQEFNMEDDWEELHAHEMEAMEEEMCAMEAFGLQQVGDNRPQTSNASNSPNQPPTVKSNALVKRAEDTKNVHKHLDQVLARCANLLGEEGDDDMAIENAQLDFEHKERQAATTNAAFSSSYLLSRPPVDIDSLSVVLSDGKRMFLRKKRSSNEHVTPGSVRSLASSLVSIKELMDTVERMEIEEATTEVEDTLHEADLDNHERLFASNAVLWLDKYRPRSFLDLLSDERTNREVLSWIKSWDRFVFPKKKHFNGAHLAKQILTGTLDQSQWNKEPTKSDSTDGDDEDKRPLIKIILICGPPGSGKTTLANIVARHAGYNPIEVNASDDRTASVLRNKIVSAMEMQSIWGERRPNCIILDEIDGAMNGTDGKSAIDVIKEIVNAPLQKKKSGGKSVVKNRHPLTRPLICICNDLYASVLRPLRQISKIFTLDSPHSQRLVSRLKYICRNEGIKVSTGALAALCSSAENDIRYCLNTLQFQSTRSRGAVMSKLTLSNGLVAQKDHVHGMFEVLDLVFYEARSNMKKGEIPAAEKISEAVASIGNFPLLISGLDENVPRMIFNDPTLKNICDVFEWLGLADEYETRARSDQQFFFQAYIEFAAIATHRSCCTSSRRRVEYPRAQFEAQKRQDRCENILVALSEGAHLQPIVRVGTSVLVVDVVPCLIASLSPNIRRINPSLQTKKEQIMIQRLIELMASLGLSFCHKFLPDGTEDYELEPALYEIVKFQSSEGTAVQQSMLPLSVRKMIAREVELEQMRRSENKSPSVNNNDNRGLHSVSKQSDKVTIEEKAANATYALPKLSEVELLKKDEALRKQNPFAFAHREAKRKRDEELNAKFKQQCTNDSRRHNMVRYKYNEGYTCGIKTVVYVRDLI